MPEGILLEGVTVEEGETISIGWFGALPTQITIIGVDNKIRARIPVTIEEEVIPHPTPQAAGERP
jgi:hypothetical protein